MKKEFRVTLVCNGDAEDLKEAAYGFWAEWLSPEVEFAYVEIQEIDHVTGVEKGPVYEVVIDGDGNAEIRGEKR